MIRESIRELSPDRKHNIVARIVDLLHFVYQDFSRIHNDPQTRHEAYLKAYDIAFYLVSEYEAQDPIEYIVTSTNLLRAVENEISNEIIRNNQVARNNQ